MEFILLIQHSQIINNSTPFDGGGIAASFDSQVTLHNNRIANNSSCGLGPLGCVT